MSVVLDRERDALSYFSIVSRFKPLPKIKSDEFVLMSLEKIALEHEDMNLLLIPCTDLYSSFVERNREWIEKRFIIRFPENAETILPR
jgi:predicted ATP-grasp superfamily ATP-dependent carboligase